jgi:hypothetical protein
MEGRHRSNLSGKDSGLGLTMAHSSELSREFQFLLQCTSKKYRDKFLVSKDSNHYQKYRTIEDVSALVKEEYYNASTRRWGQSAKRSSDGV